MQTAPPRAKSGPLLLDPVRTIARKPYPAIESMRNVQRLLKTQNPRIGDVNVEDLVESR